MLKLRENNVVNNLARTAPRRITLGALDLLFFHHHGPTIHSSALLPFLIPPGCAAHPHSLVTLCHGHGVKATLLFGSQHAVSVCLRYPIPVGHCQ